MTFDARKAKLLEPGAHLIIVDCPGLRLEVSTTGRAWIYRYKSPVDQKMRQIKLGQWPAKSISVAINEWSTLRDIRSLGKDPSLERKAKRQQEKQIAITRLQEKTAAKYTVRLLVDDYITGHIERSRKDKGVKEVKRMFNTMLGELAEAPATSVTRATAFDFLDSFLDIPVQCLRIKHELASAWDYALDAGRLPADTPNWWRLVMNRRIKSKGKVIAGKNIGTAKRSLSEVELATLIKWFPNFSRLIEDALTLYLWTCTRGSEIMSMEAHEIKEEEDGLWWTIPKSKTKSARHEGATDQRVPLVGRAAAVVCRRRLVTGKGYLFPSPGKYGFVEQKTIQSTVWLHQPYATTRPEVVRPRLTVTHWAPHDLRRSARTILASLGCPDEVGEAILGHKPAGIVRVYNRHDYDKERREWLTRLDSHLESLLAR